MHWSVEQLRIIIAVFAGQQRPIPCNNPTHSTCQSQESILIFEFRYSIFPPLYPSASWNSPPGYLLAGGWRRVYGVICSVWVDTSKLFYVENVEKNRGFFSGESSFISFWFPFFGSLFICWIFQLMGRFLGKLSCFFSFLWLSLVVDRIDGNWIGCSLLIRLEVY